RVNRAKYWIGFGIAYGMMVLAMTLWFAVPENDQVATGVGLWIIGWNVSLFALATKRLHDLDMSGWWLLGFLIVFAVLVGTRQEVLGSIGSAALFAGIIWLGSAKGTEGRNRYGPSPIFGRA